MNSTLPGNGCSPPLITRKCGDEFTDRENGINSAPVSSPSGDPSSATPVRASEIRDFMFDLRQIARGLLAAERNAHSVQSADLVQSAFCRNTVRGSAWQDVTWENRRYFFADMIRAMRRSLIDRARRSRAAKRPSLVFCGPEDMPMDFSGDLENRPERLALLEEALEELEKSKPEVSILIEYHYYMGLTAAEVASILEVSEKTVDRGLKKARILLAERMLRHHKGE